MRANQLRLYSPPCLTAAIARIGGFEALMARVEALVRCLMLQWVLAAVLLLTKPRPSLRDGGFTCGPDWIIGMTCFLVIHPKTAESKRQ